MPTSPDTDVIIVALPAADDPVVRASSEKAAHMTMIYFGKQSLADDVIEAAREQLALLAASTAPVTAPVLSREVLGDNEADVLMVDPGPLRSVRDALLEDPKLRAAYDAVKQYPQWTPHVTLGYPDRPATASPPEGVVFDRLALWTEDDAGEEFPLTGDASTNTTSTKYIVLLDDADVVIELALFTSDFAFQRDDAEWLPVADDDEDDPFSGLTPVEVEEDFVDVFDRARLEGAVLSLDDIRSLVAATVQRFVRTPEGARFYGVPVGSVIEVDNQGGSARRGRPGAPTRVMPSKSGSGAYSSQPIARLDLDPVKKRAAEMIKSTREPITPPSRQAAKDAQEDDDPERALVPRLRALNTEQLVVMLEHAPNEQWARAIGTEMLRRSKVSGFSEYESSDHLPDGWDEEGRGWFSKKHNDISTTVHENQDGTWSWETSAKMENSKKRKKFSGTARSREAAMASAEGYRRRVERARDYTAKLTAARERRARKAATERKRLARQKMADRKAKLSKTSKTSKTSTTGSESKPKKTLPADRKPRGTVVRWGPFGRHAVNQLTDNQLYAIITNPGAFSAQQVALARAERRRRG